jgi:hypothetical protein
MIPILSSLKRTDDSIITWRVTRLGNTVEQVLGQGKVKRQQEEEKKRE